MYLYPTAREIGILSIKKYLHFLSFVDRLLVEKSKGCDNMKRNTLMTVFVVILALALLFCGCTPPASADPTASKEPTDILKGWLEENCSFTISYEYMNLAINGLTQVTEQTYAKDGSWVMKNHKKYWDHTSDYEREETAEFYYRYEGSQLICYSRIGDAAPQRSIMTQQALAEIAASREIMLGAPGLLPAYLEDLSLTEADGSAVFTFRLPADKVLSDGTFLSVCVGSAFTLYNARYPEDANASILCAFTADPETYRPKTLTFDFSEIKPYVLSSGALSGEYALGVDLMTMTYTFDYNFPETTQVPDHMIP